MDNQEPMKRSSISRTRSGTRKNEAQVLAPHLGECGFVSPTIVPTTEAYLSPKFVEGNMSNSTSITEPLSPATLSFDESFQSYESMKSSVSASSESQSSRNKKQERKGSLSHSPQSSSSSGSSSSSSGRRPPARNRSGRTEKRDGPHRPPRSTHEKHAIDGKEEETRQKAQEPKRKVHGTEQRPQRKISKETEKSRESRRTSHAHKPTRSMSANKGRKRESSASDDECKLPLPIALASVSPQRGRSPSALDRSMNLVAPGSRSRQKRRSRARPGSLSSLRRRSQDHRRPVPVSAERSRPTEEVSKSVSRSDSLPCPPPPPPPPPINSPPVPRAEAKTNPKASIRRQRSRSYSPEGLHRDDTVRTASVTPDRRLAVMHLESKRPDDQSVASAPLLRRQVGKTRSEPVVLLPQTQRNDSNRGHHVRREVIKPALDGPGMHSVGGVEVTQPQAPGQDERTHPTVLSPKSSPLKELMAAELAADTDELMEQRIRQQILKESARKDVVPIDDTSAHSWDSDDFENNDVDKIAYKQRHKPRGVREKLFGDARPKEEVDIAGSPDCIQKRDLLYWAVKRNTKTNMWISTVNTNQAALEHGDGLDTRSFHSFRANTREEALSTCVAMAAPRMRPFDDNPICQICKSKFALLRRPSHCRNCGACVCSLCAVVWQQDRLPVTYNARKAQLKVCLACDWLSSAFQDALLDGDVDTAKAFYGTGNVNLRSSFGVDEKGDEALYPIHAAVMGGSIELVRWLVIEHHVPLREPSRSARNLKGSHMPLLTSHGRSALALAMENGDMNILQFLVQTGGMSLFQEPAANRNLILRSFTDILTEGSFQLPPST